MDDFGLMEERTESVTPPYRTRRTANAEDVAEPSAEEGERDKQKSILWRRSRVQTHKWMEDVDFIPITYGKCYDWIAA